MIVKGKELEKYIFGTIDFTEKDGAIHPERLTPEQKAAIIAYRKDFTTSCEWTSGIFMEFETDATDVRLAFRAGKENDILFEVCENGLMTGEYKIEREEGELSFTHTFHFAGNKRVQIWFPIGVIIDVLSLECENLTPVTKSKNVAFIGDSITQGWTSEHSCCTYVALLTRALGDIKTANYGIGGYVHDPAFTKAPLPVKPDLVFVAFGTNDYGSLGADTEKYTEKLTAFYDNLVAQTGDTPIIAFTPLWRADRPEEKSNVWRNVQKSVLKNYPSVTVLDGELLVPHVKSFYQDLFLHPNDKGMMAYAENILKFAKDKICAALNK